MIKRIAIGGGILLIIAPVIIWLIYKPVRFIWPSMNGVSCVHENICIEDSTKLIEAETLYNEAKKYVQSELGEFEEYPHFIFCETQSCFERFGFNRASAQSLGTLSTVVGPKGWKKYIIEHEMIHYIQNERLGSIRFVSLPQWFVEGMAYSISQDPCENLEEPWQSYRERFAEWHRSLGDKDLWAEAKKL